MPTTWSAEDDKTLLKAVQEYQDRGKKLNWVAIHEDHLSHMDFKKRPPSNVLRGALPGGCRPTHQLARLSLYKEKKRVGLNLT